MKNSSDALNKSYISGVFFTAFGKMFQSLVARCTKQPRGGVTEAYITE